MHRPPKLPEEYVGGTIPNGDILVNKPDRANELLQYWAALSVNELASEIALGMACLVDKLRRG